MGEPLFFSECGVWSSAFRRSRLCNSSWHPPNRMNAELQTPASDRLTFSGRPSLCRSRRVGIRARCVSLRPGLSAPDTRRHCSTASPSSVRHSRGEPGCDVRNSVWPKNADQNALRAPPHGKTPSARACSLRHSRRVRCVREAGPTHAKGRSLSANILHYH